jgi:molecular chaperone GrpE
MESKEQETKKSFYTLEEIEKLTSEANDKYLRLAADFDNFKRRVSKEKEEIKSNTKSLMLSAILDLDSDISIAVKQEKDNAGLNLFANKLTKFLSQQGIESIQTETYDKDIHEVISVLEIGEEKIVDVVSKGYILNDKPIRYPKIILGK